MTEPATRVVCIGVHDVHVATVDAIPEGSNGALVDAIRMSPAGTAGGSYDLASVDTFAASAPRR